MSSPTRFSGMKKDRQPGDTDLMAAVREKNIPEIERLLKSKFKPGQIPQPELQAFVNETNRDGNTALHLIAQSKNTQAGDIIKIMLQAGVDRNLKNKSNNTAYALASRDGNTALATILANYVPDPKMNPYSYYYAVG